MGACIADVFGQLQYPRPYGARGFRHLYSSQCLLDAMGRAARQAHYATHSARYHCPSCLSDELAARSSETSKPDRSRHQALLGYVLVPREVELRRANRAHQWKSHSAHNAVRVH